MNDNQRDNDESEDSDNNRNSEENVKQISKFVDKSLSPNENILSKEEIMKNKLIEDITNTMKLMDIEDNGIEVLDDNIWYFRNDPVYQEANGYIVGEELGEGSFGYVKEFVHKYSLRRFAAKIMYIERIAKRGQNYFDNIKIEINLVKKLNHKNVIHIFDFFSIDKKYYLILEYCYAVLEEYLRDRIAPNNLPKSQSHLYFCQLIEGLDYLHSIGIIHRDIKPANILINTSNQVKITDFGVCYVLDKFDESDILMTVEGTPYYTPPEVFSEPFKGYSGSKYDIWSSGITLYVMLTGEVPFQNTDLRFYENLVNSDIEYPEHIVDDRPLLNLLQKIFIKDFEKRITIEEIKRHPWFVLKHSQKDFRSLPQKNTGDVYRSISIMPYVQNRYSSSSSSDDEEMVSKEEYEMSNDRTPNIRSNRLRIQRKPRKKRRIPPLRRIARLGLGLGLGDHHNNS